MRNSLPSLAWALTIGVALTVAGCSQRSPDAPASTQPASAAAPTPSPAPAAVNVPAGAYTLDKTHASLVFKVSHLGFSNYTARFKRFDAQLQFDPKAPEAATLSATVDVNSLETDYPDPSLDFNAQIQGKEFLDVAQFPQITFRSTKVQTGPGGELQVTGDFTMHGVTRPLALLATFNGGYAGHSMDPHARIGFSAHTSLKRSDFGIAYGIPAPGTTMGVGDKVDILIECEFSGPPLAAEAGTPSASAAR